MKAYRVEDQRRGHGIWRDFDGKVNPVFSKLTQGKCKDMPMEDSEFYRYCGKQWFSATDTPEKLKAWFSALDVVEMLDLGYSVFEFEISSCRVVSEYEICFTRDCIISQKEIEPRDIYGAEYEKALKTMSKEKQIDIIRDLLIEFDEMGFIPTTTVPDPEAYAIKWRAEITKAFEDYCKQGNLFLLKENGDIVNLTARSEWISVEDRLPQKHDEVLVFCDGARHLDFICSSGRWYDHDHKKVTHWMPLPEAPR